MRDAGTLRRKNAEERAGMNIRFDGKTAVVTGGGHGLGREMTRALCALGANVWTCDLIPENLEETRRK